MSNGRGRRLPPAGAPAAGHPRPVAAFGRADLVVVVGAPLDFRLGYGVFGGKDDAPAARVVHLADSPGQVATHVKLAGIGGRRPDAVARRRPRGVAAPRAAPAVRRLDRDPAATPREPRSRRTAACWPATPTRSTRPGSTASCCRGWPTTRW